MKNFRWGILGTGGIAQAFVEDLSRAEGHRVVAVGSRSINSAQKFASTIIGATAYGTYEDLVADESVDAIYVATPHPMHEEHSLLAMNAGKPVLCEKPFAMSAIQAQSMINASHINGVALLEAMWTRYLPHIAMVRQILRSNVLGQIQTVEADHGQRLADQGIARLVDPHLGGGALLDLGIYPISFAHLILGAPAYITARAVMTDRGVDAQTSAIFDYNNGAQAIINTTMIAQTPCRAVVSGLLGRLEIDRTFYNPSSMRVVLFDGTTTEYPNSYSGHGLREQAIEMARVVRAGILESPLMPHHESISVMKSMDEIRSQIKLKYPFEN
ncbi:MAG: Gfo/Idh/MocA family oxidoreductase [Candidatus Planktophila sp.]|nr:Gfo/Idh/MocA family oxidoreductase [Candidatus Planktophila sp.]